MEGEKWNNINTAIIEGDDKRERPRIFFLIVIAVQMLVAVYLAFTIFELKAELKVVESRAEVYRQDLSGVKNSMIT